MEKIRLEECCEILDSKRVPITAKDRKSGRYPYYGANGIQDYVDDYIFDDELVLLAEDGGNFGSKERPIAYRVSGKCWVNNHAHVLKAKEMLDIDYLCYSLMFYDVGGMVNGATRQKLTQSQMRQMLIPKRSLEEQKEIVKKLARLTRIKDKRREQLNLLDNLIKSRFVEMFGDILINDKKWKFKKLSEISTSRLGKMLDQKKKYGFPPKKYLANFNVQWFEFVLENLNTMEFSEKEIKEFELLKGDILMCEGGEVGRCAIWKEELEDVYFQKALHRIRLQKDTILPEYFTYYMYLRATLTKFNEIVGTATISHLTGVQLKAIEVPVPPLDIQNQFVTFIQATDKLKVEVKKSLDETQFLFDSLMQEYFE